MTILIRESSIVNISQTEFRKINTHEDRIFDFVFSSDIIIVRDVNVSMDEVFKRYIEIGHKFSRITREEFEKYIRNGKV